MLSIEEEVDYRNEYLYQSSKLRKIKSYYLWTENSIEKKSIQQRLQWWKSLEEYQEKKEPLYSWITVIIYKLLMMKNMDVKTEFCSKRNGDTMMCDI